MAPEICNGSYVQIRPISDLSPIFWGSKYVVVMEDYRMVKILRRHHDPDKVILHSINPQYDDMEVYRKQIKKLYMVEAIFNYEIIS
jgi:phage repressor protein C with HTH and peptisase S24 domain